MPWASRSARLKSRLHRSLAAMRIAVVADDVDGARRRPMGRSSMTPIDRPDPSLPRPDRSGRGQHARLPRRHPRAGRRHAAAARLDLP